MTIDELESLKEGFSLLELSNEILLKELQLHVREKHELVRVLENIKNQYDSDFCKEELEKLFEDSPRDRVIYELVVNGLKNFN